MLQIDLCPKSPPLPSFFGKEDDNSPVRVKEPDIRSDSMDVDRDESVHAVRLLGAPALLGCFIRR